MTALDEINATLHAALKRAEAIPTPVGLLPLLPRVWERDGDTDYPSDLGSENAEVEEIGARG